MVTIWSQIKKRGYAESRNPFILMLPREHAFGVLNFIEPRGLSARRSSSGPNYMPVFASSYDAALLKLKASSTWHWRLKFQGGAEGRN